MMPAYLLYSAKTRHNIKVYFYNMLVSAMMVKCVLPLGGRCLFMKKTKFYVALYKIFISRRGLAPRSAKYKSAMI